MKKTFVLSALLLLLSASLSFALGAKQPTYPNNHVETWNCYICHETSIRGVTTPEPHGHAFDAPDDCVLCHDQGAWDNPRYAGGHNWSQNCLGCHSGQHGKTWQEKAQCLVCHRQETSGCCEDQDPCDYANDGHCQCPQEPWDAADCTPDDDDDDEDDDDDTADDDDDDDDNDDNDDDNDDDDNDDDDDDDDNNDNDDDDNDDDDDDDNDDTADAGIFCALSCLNGYWDSAAQGYRHGLIDIELYDDSMAPAFIFEGVELGSTGEACADLGAAGVPDGNYYVVLRNYNHFDIAGAAAVFLSSTDANANLNLMDPANVSCGDGALIFENHFGGVWCMPAGDAVPDGTANIFDFNNMGQNWATADPASDYNGDGVVNVFDFNLLGINWGRNQCPDVPAADDDDDDDNDDNDDDDNDDDDNNDNDNDDNDNNDDDNDDNDDNDNDDNDDDDTSPPTYPTNHDPSWDCYICHEISLQGVTVPEPHGHAFAAPDDCVLCHQMGDWVNPYYFGGHNWDFNCLGCHGTNKHNRTGWTTKDQCRVCHGVN